MTQCEKILAHMRSHGSITSMEAMHAAYRLEEA